LSVPVPSVTKERIACVPVLSFTNFASTNQKSPSNPVVHKIEGSWVFLRLASVARGRRHKWHPALL